MTSLHWPYSDSLISEVYLLMELGFHGSYYTNKPTRVKLNVLVILVQQVSTKWASDLCKSGRTEIYCHA